MSATESNHRPIDLSKTMPRGTLKFLCLTGRNGPPKLLYRDRLLPMRLFTASPYRALTSGMTQQRTENCH